MLEQFSDQYIALSARARTFLDDMDKFKLAARRANQYPWQMDPVPMGLLKEAMEIVEEADKMPVHPRVQFYLAMQASSNDPSNFPAVIAANFRKYALGRVRPVYRRELDDYMTQCVEDLPTIYHKGRAVMEMVGVQRLRQGATFENLRLSTGGILGRLAFLYNMKQAPSPVVKPYPTLRITWPSNMVSLFGPHLFSSAEAIDYLHLVQEGVPGRFGDKHGVFYKMLGLYQLSILCMNNKTHRDTWSGLSAQWSDRNNGLGTPEKFQRTWGGSVAHSIGDMVKHRVMDLRYSMLTADTTKAQVDKSIACLDAAWDDVMNRTAAKYMRKIADL
jgi:hypothetical protein